MQPRLSPRRGHACSRQGRHRPSSGTPGELMAGAIRAPRSPRPCLVSAAVASVMERKATGFCSEGFVMEKTNPRASQSMKGWSCTALAAVGRGDLLMKKCLLQHALSPCSWLQAGVT